MSDHTQLKRMLEPMFTPAQTSMLNDKLDQKHVKQLPGRHKASYLEGWHLINEANRVFGFGNWSREAIEMRELSGPAMIVAYDAAGKEVQQVAVSYMCRIRITVVSDDGSRTVIREGHGVDRGLGQNAGEAYAIAIKAAETDAMKRALSTFGNIFGLALYDKSRSNVGTPSNRPAAIDVGFEDQRRPPPERLEPISQRAIAASNGPTSQPQRSGSARQINY
jgi:recombination DNA repair RAD52 pathway protein